MDPTEEPCGCPYGSADHPTDENIDTVTTKLVECLECGATWTTAQDNVWFRVAERAAYV